MKQTYRLNTFETNSSSTHSMIIVPDELYADWNDNKLFYAKYTKGGEIEKLIKANNNCRFFTKEFLENNAEDFPKESDFEGSYDDYEDAFMEWLDMEDLITAESIGEYLEVDEEEYTTKNGEKLHIICQYGYDG